jgi:hypothetical protein
MPRPDEPRWLRLAQALHGACLRLFPRRMRDAHGDEMRQAFRDRAREVAAGRGGAWRLLAHDAVIDSARAATAAHLDLGLGPSRPRHAVLLFVLLGAIALLVFQDAVGLAVSRGAKATKQFAMRTYSEMYRRRVESAARELAHTLLASGNPDDRALGAWMLSANPRFSWRKSGFQETSSSNQARLYEDMAKARAGIASVADAPSRFALAVATVACGPRIDCDDARVRQRLEALDPRNAYAAFKQFSMANKAGDDRTAVAALDRAAHATHFNDFRDETRWRALRAAVAAHHGDDDALADVARYIGQSDGPWHDFGGYTATTYCQPPYVNPYTGNMDRVGDYPRFWDRHPEQRETCISVARMLWRSTGLRARERGGQLLLAFELPEAPTNDALREMSRRAYRGSSPDGPIRRPRFDHTDEEWATWAKQVAGSRPDAAG